MATLSHLASTTKLVTPMLPGFDRHSFVERKEILAANGNNVVTSKEYNAEAALELGDFAPFMSRWKANRRPRRLPQVSDFDSARKASDITAVHLVDTSSSDAGGFRYLVFDRGTRLDGRDFSGVHVAEYPGKAVRDSTLVDYESAVRAGRCSLMEVSIESDGPPRKYARLILPVSEHGAGKADRLLVVVRLLECEHGGHPSASGLPSLRDRNTSEKSPASGLPDWLAETAQSRTLLQDRHDPAARMLREYFHGGLQEFLDDGRLLEFLLMRSMPASRARELADCLVAEFGNLSTVVAMSNERLLETANLPVESVVDLKIVRELAARLVLQQLPNKNLLSDTREVIDYCHARMAYETVEHVRLLFLDQKNHLIKDEAIHGGSVSAVPVHPRQVIKRAILLDAQSIILAHNHPSGDPSPSAADVELTLELKRCAQAVGIRLLDHLIIGQSGHVSLRGMGYLDLESN